MTDIFVQSGMALALVIVLIIMFAHVYKKRSRQTGLIRLVSYQALGQKMSVAALKIGEEILVLGITPTDLKVLKKLDGSLAAADAPGEQEDGGPVRGLFRRAGSGSAGTGRASGGIRERVDRLRRIKEGING